MFKATLYKSAIAGMAVAALAGCGSSSASGPDAYKLLTHAKGAAKTAKSVRIIGTFDNAGQHATINMAFSGGALAGTVSQGTGAVGLVEVGGSVYVKVTKGFLEAQHAPAKLCSLMCGKYFKATAAQSQQFTTMVAQPSLLGRLFKGLPKSSAGFSGVTFQPATVNGQAAQCAHSHKYRICVAAHGTPYLLEVSTDGGKQAFRFTDWNKVPAIQAPPKSQTIDLSQLGG